MRDRLVAKARTKVARLVLPYIEEQVHYTGIEINMPALQSNLSAIYRMDTVDPETGDLNVIIETPKGSRNKFDFDPEHGIFRLGGVLPEGAVFPFEFGFLPSTLGEDGDPLDMIVLMDAPSCVGCLITARVIGVIEAEQTEKGKTERNDRLISIATHAHLHSDIKSLKDINAKLVDEMEHFFISYNQVRGKIFKPLGRFGPKPALELIEKGKQKFKAKRSRKK